MLFLLFIDIGSIFLLGYLETQREKLTQSILLQKELDSALTNLSAARQSYENERKLTHDFQNQMAVLQGILEKNDTNQDALTYLHQVFHYAGSESLSVTTNRIAVDVLLDLKYQMAKKQNIQFHVRLDDLSSFPVPDNALVVLLSNLLDNAIEACMKLPKESERIIIVKMKVNPEECILYVKNTAMIPQNQNGSLPKTTKPDTVQHGFGFKNIISIVNQYNGMYAINQDNGWFAFAASFPFVLC
jgi:sensor histidine kinase regulating citrate/malate metabolism